MKYDFIDDFLLSKKGVTKDFQADWNWIRYKVDDKMFVAICLDDNDKPVYITLKLNPIDGEFFRNNYEDIIPGYYMNKTHWNSIKADGNVPDDVVKELLDKSYNEILNKLTKKKRVEILSL
ncbi:MmcQ/YjbR family DNA-binding protein [uncultured Eubacterium sp.]|uniref:MmcQ/YjbR family DNA-binding protein n=1 Tax=uncultured Eubacterium sp. TaxID=165185 RepID=UPI0025E27C11|nr:MmcQ/YjbR family DNA-binding protein [uncultured Eubacterium sp.]